MANENLLFACKAAYEFLAPISNQWEGRNTSKGQSLLCFLRDAIAEATGEDALDVQDAAEEPKS